MSSIDPEQLAARRDHREVAHAAVEHLEQHAAAEPVGRDRVGGRRHHGRYRRVAGQTPAATTRRAQVAVGDDPEAAVASRTTTRGRPLGASCRAAPRGSASRARRRRARRASAPPTGWWAGSRGCPRSAVANAPARLEQRAGDEASPPGRASTGRRRLRRSGSRGCPRAARAVKPAGRPDSIEPWPNSSPGPSRSSTPAVVDHLDAPLRPCARGAPARRPGRGSCPRRVELDLGRAGDARDLVDVERVERRVGAQEPGDLERHGGCVALKPSPAGLLSPRPCGRPP